MSTSLPHTPCRVLVVEENDQVRDLIVQVLQDAGYRVLATDHLIDPIDVQQLRPIIVLLDIVFKGKCIGWDYLRLLRMQPGMAHLPVMVCTEAYEHVRAATATELTLANALVLKPFEIDDLLDTIESTLNPMKVFSTDAFLGSVEDQRAVGKGLPPGVQRVQP